VLGDDVIGTVYAVESFLGTPVNSGVGDAESSAGVRICEIVLVI